MSAILDALLAEIERDEHALDQLAQLLAPRLVDRLRPTSASPYLNVEQAAKRMHCSKQHVYDLKYQGRIKSANNRRPLLFTVEEIETHITNNGSEMT
jgi:hypothetical protein